MNDDLALSKEQIIYELATHFALAALFFHAAEGISKGSDEWMQKYRRELSDAENILDECSPSELKEIFTELKIETQSGMIKTFLAWYFLEQLIKVEEMLNSSQEKLRVEENKTATRGFEG